MEVLVVQAGNAAKLAKEVEELSKSKMKMTKDLEVFAERFK